MNNFSQKIYEYAEHLESTGYAPSAIRAYNSRLRGFLTFLNDHAFAHDEVLNDHLCMEQALEKYGVWLKQVGVRATSINSIQTALKGFCRFLGMRRLNVTRQLEVPSESLALSALQLANFEHAIASSTNLRDKTIATVILKAGLRPSECAALNTNDIRFEGELCFIRTGRNANSRIIALDAAVSRTIFDHMCSIYAPDTAPLFTTKFGVRLSVASIDLALKNIGRVARLDVSAKRLRDTFISQLVSSGLDMTDIAALGGTSVDTLRRFYPAHSQVGTPLFVPANGFVASM